jgi:hypothetical protein
VREIRMLRTMWWELETELRVGLRHRHAAKAAGKQLLPGPTTTAPIFDPTCEGLRHNWCMAEILWHRRETRRQTENTNIMPVALEGLSLLDKTLRLVWHLQAQSNGLRG